MSRQNPDLMWNFKFAHGLARRRHILVVALAPHDYRNQRFGFARAALEPSPPRLHPTVDDLYHLEAALPEEENARLLLAAVACVRFDPDAHGSSQSDRNGRRTVLIPVKATPIFDQGGRDHGPAGGPAATACAVR